MDAGATAGCGRGGGWAGCGAHLGPGVEEVEVDESQLQGVYVLWVQVGVGGGVGPTSETCVWELSVGSGAQGVGMGVMGCLCCGCR